MYITHVYNTNVHNIETDQGQDSLEEISEKDKDKQPLFSLSFSLWNCRSFTYVKKALINSRNEDLVILNET